MATEADKEKLNLTRYKGLRKRARASITTLLTGIDKLIKAKVTNAEDLEELAMNLEDQLALLELKEKTLSEQDAEIGKLITCTDEDDPILATEADGVGYYQEQIALAKNRLKRKIKSLEKNEVAEDNGSVSGSISGSEEVKSLASQLASDSEHSKLPTLTLQKFRGDISEWPGFWSQFKSSIDERRRLSKVDKFNYLMLYLEGEPKRSLAGFTITEDNYEEAVKLLKERYDRSDLVVHTIMNKLLRLEPVENSSDLVSLRNLYNACETNLRSLNALDVDFEANSYTLCSALVSCLPDDIRLKYTMTREKEDEWSVKAFTKFLQNEVLCRETSAMLKPITNPKRATKTHDNTQTTREARERPRPPKSGWSSATTLTTNVSQRRIYCIFCKVSTHATLDCSNYTLEEKRNLIKRQGRCTLCTRIGHETRYCNSRFQNCTICRGRHNHVICEDNKAHKGSSNIRAVPESTGSDSTATNKVSVSSFVDGGKTVLLQTAMAIAKSPGSTNNQVTVRCVLDNCSQTTFIREDISRKLQLPIIGERMLQIGNFGNETPITSKRKVVRLTIQNAKNPGEEMELTAIESPFLCTAVTLINCEEVERFAEERSLILADEPSQDTPAVTSIGILIGADQYYEIATGRIEQISRNLVAAETKLGWAIQGPVSTKPVTTNSTQVLVMKVSVIEAEINKTLKSFFDIESLGILDSPDKMSSGLEILEQFEKETSYDERRYLVKFPWNIPKQNLPDNFQLATNRMKTLVRRFLQDPVLYLAYKAVIDEQLQLGIAERVPNKEIRTPGTYYLPHQPVKRDSSSTTKSRVVLDGSAHVKGAPSLNDCISSGPNLNPDILKLILRFRTHRIAMTADIEKAFLQVSLAESERDSVRFLWIKEDQNRPLENEFEELRMARVPFGVTASPFLLAATIKLHIKKYAREEENTVQSLNEDLYVDDFASGAENVDKAYHLSNSASKIMKGATMNLRKWTTNSPELRTRWREECEKTGNLADLNPETETGNQKVLGLLWNPDLDEFTFDLSKLSETFRTITPTKRHVLSAVSQIYDPMGIISPYVIRAKIMFQLLWKLNLKWDEELKEPLKKEFEEWRKEMPAISKIKLHRCYFPGEETIIHKELHTFCDASSKAYAAVVYLRYVTDSGKIGVSFMTSKTRVAPLKSEDTGLTIARLELMGCLLGARLAQTVKESIKAEEIPEFYWSDSMIAIYWIKGDAKVWRPFVQNRVKQITDISSGNDWRHCAGVDNPADIPSRGAKTEDLAISRHWWEGPDWLKTECNEWPSQEQLFEIKEDDLESEKRKIVVATLTAEPSGLHNLIDLNKYTSMNKVLRITAYLQRFVNLKLKRQTEKGPITAEEMSLSEINWIRDTQELDYSNEIIALSKGNEIKNDSKIATLKPRLNQEGLLSVGGRLHQSRLAEEEKHPIILNKSQRLTQLLISRSHWQVHHSGLQATLTQSRGRFWTISARQVVKAVIKNCMVCRRFRAKPGTAPMAPLPRERIEESPPFATIGLDFAGPVYVKRGENLEKAYICLCTCAVTRAIHLELVPFLNTYEFILAFRRIVARRGIPHIIFSDNAKTFIRANEDLKLIWKCISDDQTKEYFGQKGISWRYIADRAAWWGGFWERLVRTVKNTLRKVLGRAQLSYQEMETALVETEAIINSRPITYIFSETNEPSPLTPSHLLIGKRLTCLPPQKPKESDIPNTQRQISKRLRYREALMERLWKRWRQEYLMELNNAHHFLLIKTKREIKLGEVVMIHEERIPRQMWKLGVVTEVIKGRDENIRSCYVRTPNGNIIRRPISLIYSLEITN